MALLDLLRKQREEMAQKRARNGLNTAKLTDGTQYIRVFPNKENPDASFFQPFGMHYVKAVGEDGKTTTNTYFCEANTNGGHCELCEMVMEGRAVHKGNTAMETRIKDMRAAQRYLVNGIISKHADFSDVEKTEILELPSSVFEDMIKLVEEDLADNIGNPLDMKEGYGFLVKRAGAGRDTEYTVSPHRKRGPVEEKFQAGMHDLVAFVNQVDETKRLATIKSMSRLLGVPMSASVTTAALPATGTHGILPGFGSVTGHTVAETVKETSVIDDAIAQAADAEFSPTPVSTADAATAVAEAAATSADADDLNALMAELNSLG